MSLEKQLVRAIKLAVAAHGMTLDKGGMPYILHPLHVMLFVKSMKGKIVAVLHDTVEDTEVTIAPDRRGLFFRFNPKNFTGVYSFDSDIIDALDAITKREGENLEEYWSRVKVNPLALEVKLVDIAHNSSPARLAVLPREDAERLLVKYSKALEFLQS